MGPGDRHKVTSISTDIMRQFLWLSFQNADERPSFVSLYESLQLMCEDDDDDYYDDDLYHDAFKDYNELRTILLHFECFPFNLSCIYI